MTTDYERFVFTFFYMLNSGVKHLRLLDVSQQGCERYGHGC